MEMQKLEKSVIARRARVLRIFAYVLAGSLTLNLVQCAGLSSLAHDRDAYQRAEIRAWEQNDLIRMRERSLESQLREMTETAGYHRSYGVYHDCVQQNLGIYQMKEVARAYDQFFRTTELSARCLAESAWYKTHPIGINPADLNH